MTAVAKSAQRPRTRARGGLPLLEGLLPLEGSLIPTQIVAGITLACLAIPEVMGYTSIAQTPVIYGLYTILLPVILFAILGSSRHLVVGADSATAAILAAGLAGMAAPSSAEWVSLAAMLALIAGVFLLLARVMRLGFLANFLSRSVLIGFLTGVGIQVACGQVPKLFALPKQGSGPIEYVYYSVTNLAAANWANFAVAAAVIAIIVIGDRIAKRIPWALIAVLGTIGLSYAMDWGARMPVLGPVPGGLPQLGLPQGVSQQQIVDLLPTAFAIFIVILAQSAATSRAYAMRYSDSFSENVDLVGLSFASFGAGLTGTFVVNGSPTKTQMLDSAGGRNQVAHLTMAAVVAVVLLFLTGPLSYMPNAVLAGVVFLIGVELVDWKGMADIYRLRPFEFGVALITAVVTCFVGVEQGIILALVLSVVEHIYHSYKPHDVLLSPDATGEMRAAPRETGTQAAPGLIVYRFGASLYYANTNLFMEEVMQLVEDAQSPVRWLCLDAAAVGDIDYSGAYGLGQLRGELESKGVTLVLADVTDAVRRQLDAYGLTEKIGAERIFAGPAELLAAYRELGRPSPDGSAPGPAPVPA